MTVFKTILKILNKLKGMLILYTGILLGITLLNQTSGQVDSNFEESKPDILIVNNDEDNEITENFVAYLREHSEEKDIDVEDEEKINDAVFYRDVNYVIYIPKNFGEDLLAGKNPKLEYKSSGDEQASYAEMMVEKYIKTVSLYKDYYSGDELLEKVNDVAKIDTKVEMKSKLDTSKLSSMTRYFNFLNYALLAGCVYCISMILASLKEEHVRKRTIISSFSMKTYNRIVLFSNAIVIFVMWLLYMALSFLLFKDLMISANGVAFMINSFVFTICSLSIGYLIGNITQNKNAIGGIVNVIALGTSFLCGCFVPTEFMPDYVIKIAHILPTQYFVANNEIIKTMEVFDFAAIKPLLVNGGVVVGFSIVFILITNYIIKATARK